MTEPTSGTIGKIIPPDEINEHHFENPPQLAEDEVVVTINQSDNPAKIDRFLRKWTREIIGFSIEPSDTHWIIVDRTTATLLQEGAAITTAVEKGCRV